MTKLQGQASSLSAPAKPPDGRQAGSLSYVASPDGKTTGSGPNGTSLSIITCRSGSRRRLVAVRSQSPVDTTCIAASLAASEPAGSGRYDYRTAGVSPAPRATNIGSGDWKNPLRKCHSDLPPSSFSERLNLHSEQRGLWLPA